MIPYTGGDGGGIPFLSIICLAHKWCSCLYMRQWCCLSMRVVYLCVVYIVFLCACYFSGGGGDDDDLNSLLGIPQVRILNNICLIICMYSTFITYQ